MAVTLSSKITELPGVGPNYAKKLEKLGVNTVRELLFYFPRRWDDFSKITPIAEIRVGETVSVKGTIFDISTKRSKRGVPVTEAIITDETGTTKAVWFNQPFLEKTLKKGDEIYLAGTLEFNYGQVSFPSPAYEKVEEDTGVENLKHVGRIIPVYSETEGLTSKWLRSKIAPLAKLVYGIHDHLPETVKSRFDLSELSSAVRAMHYPENMEDLKRAQKRFLYDNLFCLFCAVLSVKKVNDANKAVSVEYNDAVGKKFVHDLPFELTDSQRASSWAILKDLAKTTPMNRLLEGDVGSGKTVVAAMASLMVAAKGYQVAVVAPTEILAQQHFESFKKLLTGFDVRVALLTGSTSKEERTEIEKGITDGDIQIIIGTHALFSEKLKFWTLALVIVDEQHRFGVEQRMALKTANGEAKKMPHFLSMSATPIPRTLALTVFGDLEISTLTDMPPGRKKIATHLVPPEKRADAYNFIREKIEAGRQVFVICPLISASDKLGVKSAEEEAVRLRGIFKKQKVGLLHGKMKPAEKEAAMADFKSGKTNILVSTSVIEVGVDVPNATVMVIEGADRFGLAQLHQFRGRVGRGEHESWCFIFTESNSEVTMNRLEALIKSANGFELAEKDLEIRGPGEILGLKQHGKLDETLLDVMRNPRIIGEVKEAASEFLIKENLTKYPLLYEKVADFGIAAKLE
jgi:ATP-dependent DNA helicase RecG